MATDKPVNLEELEGEEIEVKPKGKQRMKGTLVRYDDYMNLVLKNVSEYKDGEKINEYDLMIIKGGNIQSITA